MNFIHWEEKLGCCNSQEATEHRKKNMFRKSLNKTMAQKVTMSFNLETLWFLLPENFTKKYELLLPRLRYLYSGLEGCLLSESLAIGSGLSYKHQISLIIIEIICDKLIG